MQNDEEVVNVVEQSKPVRYTGSSEREDETEEQKEGGRSRKLKVRFGKPIETLTS